MSNIITEFVEQVAQEVREGKRGDFHPMNESKIFDYKISCPVCKKELWLVGWDKEKWLDLCVCGSCNAIHVIKFHPE